jgi:branched-chain amino acid transport system substrate-binding protein
MNSAAIKQAAAVGYSRDKMIGVWWSGSEPDVKPAGDDATGYKALMLQHGSGKFRVHADIERYVYGKGKGSAKAEEIGSCTIEGLLEPCSEWRESARPRRNSARRP